MSHKLAAERDNFGKFMGLQFELLFSIEIMMSQTHSICVNAIILHLTFAVSIHISMATTAQT